MDAIRLRNMMDFQKFISNENLKKIIEETESRYSGRTEISDEDQELITAAAGIADIENNKRREMKL